MIKYMVNLIWKPVSPVSPADTLKFNSQKLIMQMLLKGLNNKSWDNNI